MITKGRFPSLSCRPFLNSVSDERSYFRLMICDPHDPGRRVNDPEEPDRNWIMLGGHRCARSLAR